MKSGVALLAAVGVLFFTPACGDGGGCLSRAEVEREVNELALGFESSSAEVEAKQQEIEDVRERECAPE